MRIRELLTILFFPLTIYSFSGGGVHGIANYSACKLIGPKDFLLSPERDGRLSNQSVLGSRSRHCYAIKWTLYVFVPRTCESLILDL
jgi:hypothetical protein